MSRRVFAAVILVGAALVGVPVNVAAAATTNSDNGTDTLPNGHCLVASLRVGYPQLVSHSGRFQLSVIPGDLQLDEQISISPSGSVGDVSWWRTAPRPEPHASILCMRPGGNLVFERGDGTLIWSSRTAGRANGVSAHVTDGGALVLRSINGITIWSTRTTALLLKVGDRLRPGQSLVNRDFPGELTKLTMGRRGDLRLYRGTRQVWHTDTHVPHSYLTIGSFGRVKIVAPNGATQWRSAAYGRSAFVELAEHGRLMFRNDHHQCLVVPSSANPDCGIG